MSEAAAGTGALPARATGGRGSSSPSTVAALPPWAPLTRRVALFVSLALFSTLHWAFLLVPPPVERAVACVLVGVGGGLLLRATARLGGVRGATLRLGLALATGLASLTVAGLPPALLRPGRWADLADGLARGLAGLRTLEWPYAGEGGWVRLTVLLLVPVIVSAASALAFWPAGRRRPALRALAATLLVVPFVVAVVERPPGSAALRGAVLFLLLAAWVWRPRPGLAELGTALLGSLVAVALATGIAVRTHQDRPWIEYGTWSAAGPSTRFDWNHSYGPLDWPRTGAALLQVRSKRPHYWKAEALDYFDGRAWSRSRQAQVATGTDVPARPDPAWVERIDVTVRALNSELVVGAGSILGVDGTGPTARAADGTTLSLGGPLDAGDSYSVNAYVPDPGTARMRAAPPASEPDLSPFVSLGVPRGGEGRGWAPPELVYMGFRGDPRPPTRKAARRLLASPYADVYRLSRRLAPPAASTYDVVKAIERHLQTSYVYSERPPVRALPLSAFLFEDRRGYCQQFSGAMALMLRMNGIPARVAAGFSPGAREASGEYRVTDLDAHSWVEVFFSGIGWVPFDPTPSAAPARGQAGETSSASAAEGGSDRGDGPPRTGTAGGSSDRVSDASGGGAPGGGGEGSPAPLEWSTVATGLLALGLAALALRITGARRPRRSRRAGGDSDVGDLEAALVRAGRRPPPGTTLAELERSLAAEGRREAAAFARLVLERRFGPPGARSPGRRERRALRRDLAPRRTPRPLLEFISTTVLRPPGRAKP